MLPGVSHWRHYEVLKCGWWMHWYRLGMRSILQGVETEPHIRPMWIYGLYEVHVVALRAVNTIHRCHLYPLPLVDTMIKHKCERRALESDGNFKCRCPISSTARMFGDWFWLISTPKVHFLITHYMYITMTCFLFITYFHLLHSNPFLVLRFSGLSYVLHRCCLRINVYLPRLLKRSHRSHIC